MTRPLGLAGCCFAALMATFAAAAQQAVDVVGMWRHEGSGAIVQIRRDQNTLQGILAEVPDEVQAIGFRKSEVVIRKVRIVDLYIDFELLTKTDKPELSALCPERWVTFTGSFSKDRTTIKGSIPNIGYTAGRTAQGGVTCELETGDGSIEVQYTRSDRATPKPTVEISGVIVMDNQIQQRRDRGVRDLSYPFDASGARRGETRRTLFIWGHGLPRYGEAAQVASQSPHLTYRLKHGSLDPTRWVNPPQYSANEALLSGWAKVARVDPKSHANRAQYDAILVDVTLERGVTPGMKMLSIADASGSWPLLFQDQHAVMRFVREGGVADYDPTDVFYLGDVGFVEVVFASDIPFPELAIELRQKRARTDGAQTLGVLSATRLDDRQRPTYRTGPVHFFNADQRTALPRGLDVASVGVRNGDEIHATLYDTAEALVLPQDTIAQIRAEPTELGATWRDALAEVAKCHNEQGRTLDNAYAMEPDTRVSASILTALDVREVTLKKGDHAAALLIRDEFVRMAIPLLEQYVAIAQDPERARAFANDPRGLPAAQQLSAAAKKAANVDKCNLDELLVLAGHEAPAVVARILQRLVQKDASVMPPRWVPDLPAQGFVKGLHNAGAAVRGLREYAAIDNSYKMLGVALATVGLGALLEVGGYGTAAAYLALTADAADLAVGLAGVADYYAAEDRYQYALGATPVLGSQGFLADAEAARQSRLMTAVGVLAPGLGGAFGVKNIRDLRAIQRGRDLLRSAEHSLADIGRFSDSERTDLAAYYADLYRRATAGGQPLDAADEAALRQFRDYFANAGQGAPGMASSASSAVPTAPTAAAADAQSAALAAAQRPGSQLATPEKAFAGWKKTLNPETQRLLESDPELARLYMDMDPKVRRILTRCASPCIPPKATAENAKRISSFVGRFELSGSDLDLLTEFFHQNRGRLPSTLSLIESIDELPTLRRVVTPVPGKLFPKSVMKVEDGKIVEVGHRVEADGAVSVEYQVGDSIARRGDEELLDPERGLHRAHLVPPGHGVEDPGGLVYATPNVNLSTDQRIDNMIRRLYLKSKIAGDSVIVKARMRRHYNEMIAEKSVTVDLVRADGTRAEVFRVEYSADLNGRIGRDSGVEVGPAWDPTILAADAQ